MYTRVKFMAGDLAVLLEEGVVSGEVLVVFGGGSGRGNGHGSGGVARGATGREIKPERPVNPNGSDGKTLLCVACGSYRHLIANCPDSWENMSKTNKVNVVEEEAALFTGYNSNIETKMGGGIQVHSSEGFEGC